MHGIFQDSITSNGRLANAKIVNAHLQNRQEKVSAAKAGVRRRRGPRMQVKLLTQSIPSRTNSYEDCNPEGFL